MVQGLGASLIDPADHVSDYADVPAECARCRHEHLGCYRGYCRAGRPDSGGRAGGCPQLGWIFFINIPVGLIGLFLAWRNVPVFEQKKHSFDWLGVVLSAVGLFLLVFGIQEGATYDWGTITDSFHGHRYRGERVGV